jgi:hypothetical protein
MAYDTATKVALLEQQCTNLREEVNELRSDVNTIKSLLNKIAGGVVVLVGLGGLIGWLLTSVEKAQKLIQ